METKLIEVCTAKVISIGCVHNDSVDIKCGGPAILGYDFGVSPDEDIKAIEKHLEKFIKDLCRPFMSISHYDQKNFPVNKLWTMKRMEECIRKNPMT